MVKCAYADDFAERQWKRHFHLKCQRRGNLSAKRRGIGVRTRISRAWIESQDFMTWKKEMTMRIWPSSSLLPRDCARSSCSTPGSAACTGTHEPDESQCQGGEVDQTASSKQSRASACA